MGLIKKEIFKGIWVVINFVIVFLLFVFFIVYVLSYIKKMNDFLMDISLVVLFLGMKIVVLDVII